MDGRFALGGTIWAASLFWLVASPAAAQDRDERPAPIAELARCRTVVDAAARLACFDAAAAQLDADVSAKRITVLDRAGVRRTRRSLFGFPLPNTGLFDEDDRREQVAEVDGVIARVLPLPNQRYELVLADGARWQTTEPTRWRPTPQAKVHIRKGALGSYWIAVERTPAVRGRRTG